MTEKRFNLVDLLETLAIADGDECKYYQTCNDDFMSLCNLLNELHNENEQLKQLNIPIDEIKDMVIDYQGRVVGVYYND